MAGLEQRGLVLIKQTLPGGRGVWCCDVPGCGYSHAEPKNMEDHMGAEHSLLCLSSDFLWLDAQEQEATPDVCLCVSARQLENEWVRVSNVILETCMECVVNDVGQDIVYGPRDEQQDALLEAALDKWPTGKDYAFCVTCGSAMCSECMGDKYFPNAIEADSKKHKTAGIKVSASLGFKYFVCHDCVFDKDRLNSSYIIRSWQKLLRALNEIDSWKMHTTMQLHRHDSLGPGRCIYTLELINTDFSGNKCGRCRSCLNPSQKQGCKSMDEEYDAGEFVYQFPTDPDESFAGDSDTGTGDGAKYLDSDMPSSSKQAKPSSSKQAKPSSSKQAKPSSSKHAKQGKDVHVPQATAVRRSAEPEQISAKALQGVRQDMQRCLERFEKLVEQKEKAAVDSLKVACRDAKEGRKKAEESADISASHLRQEKASSETIRAERDRLLLDRATMAERLRSAEAVGHANEKSIADAAELFLTKLDEGLKEGLAANKKAVEASAALLSKKIGEDMKEGFDANKKAVEDLAALLSKKVGEDMKEGFDANKKAMADSATLFLKKMQEGFSAKEDFIREHKLEPAGPAEPAIGGTDSQPVTESVPETQRVSVEVQGAKKRKLDDITDDDSLVAATALKYC